MKLSRELWLEVEPLLTTALEMDVAARREWLDALDTGNPEVAPLLRRMLETHDRAERSGDMETVPRLAPSPPPSSAHSAGERIGPFRLLRPLGRGGMGEVWLAEQADGRVERQVALKLPALHLQGGVWEERFRRERDILAKLTHPNIARLYDAGVSDAGQPYLAMEYVEGESLTDYVASHALSIRERLQLFRQVLAATGHAHRHLVVHRDLKPANILIDQSGQVKLLDFGIAKLLDDEDAAANARDLTRMGGRVMTLRYAAPEQVAGGAITTATDIYALGVILHELVTGHSPYRAAREGRPLTEAMLGKDETGVPSALAPAHIARQVKGDLDAILLKAMRRNPADRYASIEQFDDDILRHLERRPVKARAGTWRYLAGRFVARHKLPLAMAAAVLVTLAAGLVMADRERRVAVAEKARAEKHFASVRKLANSFMFEVHREIENLPGSLKARQLLVSTSLEYLDKLAAESAGDLELTVEVASAYRKIAEIKGDVYSSNIGESASAIKNLRKASSLLEPLEARAPDNLKLLRERRELAQVTSRVLRNEGNADAIKQNELAINTAERIVLLPGAETEDRRQLAKALGDYGVALAVEKSDPAAAMVPIARALEYFEALVAQNPSHEGFRSNLAGMYERASIITEMSGRPEDLPPAIALLEKGIATNEVLARDFPNNTVHAQSLLKSYANIAGTLKDNHDLKAASAYSAKGIETGKRLLAASPGDIGVSLSCFRAMVVASSVEQAAGASEQSLQTARGALALFSQLPPDTRKGLHARGNLAALHGDMALANMHLAENAKLPAGKRVALLNDARALLGQSRAFRQELVDRQMDAASAQRTIVEIDAAIRQCDEAIAKLSRG